MKRYFRVMLGKKSIYASECLKEGFIGADLGIHENLSGNLPDNWRDFNKKYIPVFMAARPDKSKVAAGLACGFLWTICRGIKEGDIVLCPNGEGRYFVGQIKGSYTYAPDTNLPHRRPIHWFDQMIDRSDMSEALRNSTGSIGTVSNIDRYAEEIEKLISGHVQAPVNQSLISSDPTIEDPTIFALEKHLEDFLVHNWSQTELGKDYDIFVEDGELIGQQYQTDTGPLDILAISKDKTRLLVVELKKGRASDSVIGQVQRYMGYVKDELAKEGQSVEGVIIALEDDQRIKRALSVAPNISFYKYQVSFKLIKN
jgi:restriction system protein